MKQIKEIIAELEQGKSAEEVIDEWHKSVRWYEWVIFYFIEMPGVYKLLSKLQKWLAVRVEIR